MYTLAKELNISPSECMQLPVSLVLELLCVHQEVETYKIEKIESEMGKVNEKMPKR
tara:strand:+ start:258 stop:425 length:168 start_codon:yes stop_codon:yes gene_type:complete